MVVELIVPALGVLCISAAVSIVAHSFGQSQLDGKFKEIRSLIELMEKRIKTDVKDDISNKMENMESLGDSIETRVESSIDKLKKLETERTAFKAEVVRDLRESLKVEMSSRLRDVAQRFEMLKSDELKLEEKIETERSYLRSGIMEVNQRMNQLKNGLASMSADMKKSQQQLDELSSDKKALKSEIEDSLKKTALNVLDDKFGAFSKEFSVVQEKVQNMDGQVVSKIKTTSTNLSNRIADVKLVHGDEIRHLNSGLRALNKSIASLEKDMEKIGKSQEKIIETNRTRPSKGRGATLTKKAQPKKSPAKKNTSTKKKIPVKKKVLLKKKIVKKSTKTKSIKKK